MRCLCSMVKDPSMCLSEGGGQDKGSEEGSRTSADKGEDKSDVVQDPDTSKPVVRLALKLMYLGLNYGGFQGQIDPHSPCNSIEEHLFNALITSKLIKDRYSSCRYSKMSRTDKEVSAISQVVAFNVCEEFLEEGQVLKKRRKGDVKEKDEERKNLKGSTLFTLDLDKFQPPIKEINVSLPGDIKILAWAIVPEDFNPRHNDRKTKTYKYWFRKKDLDLELMLEGCRKFEGTHNFMNFTKLSRTALPLDCTISLAQVEECADNPKMCVFTVKGNRFLMYQIRHMVSILKKIGGKEEVPELIDELLDVQTNYSKPHYEKASGYPLCLYSTEDKEEINWIHDQGAYSSVIKKVKHQQKVHTVMAEMTKSILDELTNIEVHTEDGIINWKQTKERSPYIPIMMRHRGPPFEVVMRSRIRRRVRKKQKLDPNYELSEDEKHYFFNTD